MNNMYSEEPPSLSEGEEAASVALPKRRSFKEAFAEARKAGEKQFTWQGKRYSTELAGAAAPTRAAKSSYTGDEAASDFIREAKRGVARRGPAMYGSTFKPERSAEAQAMRGYKKGGKVSASSRGDGIAKRGKTRGKVL